MWPRVFNKIRPKIFESHDPHLFAVTVAADTANATTTSVAAAAVVVVVRGDVIIIIAFLLSFLSQHIK